ncbi:hypothetical protein AWM75_00950 [Aerococcus urinaehominis]|uniref:Uncharacterized protein n=1 Tax=Aerococcus urinaehominis TaxID=128944 RepID=A0A0X8FL59_9LACT|nr:DUF5058 family protein [Aerococcus urinaehominis]AMB98647.1 hypothetical protein AWM75_00950 [Aerococcus urinaehominis]SDL96833.1 protein of unknown function [Aerococcus urinaehominis]
MHYLDIANSQVVFLLCAGVIAIVVIQALLFLRKGYKRGQEIGMSKQDLTKVMSNSALLSIVPSLPIIVMMLALSVPLGKYFPWLRLSIVGSAIYEGTAANVAAQSQGLSDFSDPNITPKIFVIIMFAMTIGIVWGIVFNILFMNQLDKFTAKAKANPRLSLFMPIFSAALFTALLITLATPYVANAEKPISIITFIAAGLATILCSSLAKALDKKIINDFALPISLLVGMAAAIIANQML